MNRRLALALSLAAFAAGTIHPSAAQQARDPFRVRVIPGGRLSVESEVDWPSFIVSADGRLSGDRSLRSLIRQALLKASERSAQQLAALPAQTSVDIRVIVGSAPESRRVGEEVLRVTVTRGVLIPAGGSVPNPDTWEGRVFSEWANARLTKEEMDSRAAETVLEIQRVTAEAERRGREAGMASAARMASAPPPSSDGSGFLSGVFITLLGAGFVSFRRRRIRLAKENQRLNEIQQIEQELERERCRLDTVLQKGDTKTSILAEARREGRARADQIAYDAQERARKDQERLDGLIVRAQSKVTTRIEAERQAHEAATQKVEHLVEEGRRKASVILEDADRRAQMKSGEAIRALRETETLEARAETARRTLEGYGREWQQASRSFTDGLADDYGHKEAGVALKSHRLRVKEMRTLNLSADCDNLDAKRNIAAQDFVTAAFDGKADSALSSMARQPASVTETRLCDAFVTVNALGEPFLNSKVSPTYLEARLEEMRLAYVVLELKRRDAEEQRAIREQIADDLKAQREQEKALRDAERNEAEVRREMERLTREMEGRNAVYRVKAEARIADLARALDEAVERSRRVMSMAQQTRAGHVYVISNVGAFGEGVYKIGLTRRLDPMDRIQELSNASVPFGFDVHALLPSDDAPALERDIHRRLAGHQVNKVNFRKEFFRADLAEVRAAVNAAGGTEVQWTERSEAAQFRETCAMEDRFRQSPEDFATWKARFEKAERDAPSEVSSPFDDYEEWDEEASVVPAVKKDNQWSFDEE